MSQSFSLFHLIHLDFITLILLDEEYKLWSSSLCNCFHPSLISSILDPNILLSMLISDTLKQCWKWFKAFTTTRSVIASLWINLLFSSKKRLLLVFQQVFVSQTGHSTEQLMYPHSKQSYVPNNYMNEMPISSVCFTLLSAAINKLCTASVAMEVKST
jgi:hypothetical protein